MDSTCITLFADPTLEYTPLYFSIVHLTRVTMAYLFFGIAKHTGNSLNLIRMQFRMPALVTSLH
jgi:hypothetical protein